VATFTTLALPGDDESNAGVSDGGDPDIVLANGSDSSGEGKVVANSIDGEDGLVDITMKEPHQDRDSISTGETNM